MAFTSIFTGDITYTSFITMPPEWAIVDYVEIKLWAGRMAFLSQVLMHTMLIGCMTRHAEARSSCPHPAARRPSRPLSMLT